MLRAHPGEDAVSAPTCAAPIASRCVQRRSARPRPAFQRTARRAADCPTGRERAGHRASSSARGRDDALSRVDDSGARDVADVTAAGPLRGEDRAPVPRALDGARSRTPSPTPASWAQPSRRSRGDAAAQILRVSEPCSATWDATAASWRRVDAAPLRRRVRTRAARRGAGGPSPGRRAGGAGAPAAVERREAARQKLDIRVAPELLSLLPPGRWSVTDVTVTPRANT